MQRPLFAQRPMSDVALLLLRHWAMEKEKIHDPT
jgi:hypothetical protein